MTIKVKAFSCAILLSNFIFIPSAFADEAGKEHRDHNTEHREEEFQALTEVTVSADPLGRSLVEHSRPVSVLLEEELIFEKSEPSIGETIGREPGVSSSYSGPGSSRPVIRGNAGERVRVLRNGVGTADASNLSEDHAVAVNVLAAQSIEILRGPETLLFGSSAIGGVVNVTDGSIPESAIGEAVTGAVDYRQGTADDEVSGSVKLEGGIKTKGDASFNWHVNAFHQDTNDIEIPGFAESEAFRAAEEAEEHEHESEEHEGEEHEEEEQRDVLPNSSTRNRGGAVGGSYVWETGFVGASFSGFFSDYGVPGHAHGHEEGEEHDEEHEHEGEESIEEELGFEEEEEAVRIDLNSSRADFRGEFRELNSFIDLFRFKLGFSNYEHREFEGEEVATEFNNDALEGRFEFAHSADALSGVFGVQVEASDFDVSGEEAFLPNSKRFSPALFAFEEFEVNDFLKLQGGLRVEHVSIDADGFSGENYTPFSLSTGFVFDPTGEDDYGIGLSFAYTQRAPTAAELFADGAHVARTIFEVGDSNIDVEESFGLDLTFRKNSGLLSGALNLFAQQYENYINLSAIGEEVEGFPVYEYEETRALFSGFEIETTLHLHELLDVSEHHFDLGAQVDYVRARDLTANDSLPRIPPLRTVLSFDYDYLERFKAKLEGVFVEDQRRVSEFEQSTESYQQLNSYLSYTYPLTEKSDLTLYARGLNLTDEEARVHSSFIKDLAPLRGRSFLFGVRANF